MYCGCAPLCRLICCVCGGAGIATALNFISNRDKCPTAASLLTPIQKKKAKAAKGKGAKGKGALLVCAERRTPPHLYTYRCVYYYYLMCEIQYVYTPILSL